MPVSVSTYPSYKRGCGWSTKIDIPLDGSSLCHDESCDAIIIGAGYTGLSIAQRLAELCPNDDIRVLESEDIGTGSPGRNSGFVLEHNFASGSNSGAASELYYRYRQVHQELASLASLATITESSPKVFKGAATSRGMKNLDVLAKHLKASGQPFTRLDNIQIQQLTGSSYYRGGVLLPGNRLLNPYQLIRKLAAQLPSNVTIHANSPALIVEQQNNYWQITTPKGKLKAPRLYLANNAFAKALGYGKKYSVTIYTYAGVTAPLSKEELASVTAHGQWGLLPAHRLGSTIRTTDDGRLLIRSMYGYEQEGGTEVEGILAESLGRRFPHLKGAQQLEDWWGGSTSLTANGAPFWGELKEGLYVSIGCNGVGIVKGWMLGKELAQLSCRKEALDIPGLLGKPSWIPPEPLRSIGFAAVSEMEKYLASSEK